MFCTKVERFLCVQNCVSKVINMVVKSNKMENLLKINRIFKADSPDNNAIFLVSYIRKMCKQFEYINYVSRKLKLRLTSSLKCKIKASYRGDCA